MLLTEYDEEKTMKAIYYEGERAGLKEGQEQGLIKGQEQGLRMLMDMVVEDGLPIETAVRRATRFGITDEADFRERAEALGVPLTK